MALGAFGVSYPWFWGQFSMHHAVCHPTVGIEKHHHFWIQPYHIVCISDSFPTLWTYPQFLLLESNPMKSIEIRWFHPDLGCWWSFSDKIQCWLDPIKLWNPNITMTIAVDQRWYVILIPSIAVLIVVEITSPPPLLFLRVERCGFVNRLPPIWMVYHHCHH